MAGIIWLASYPKSGNTWLRAFLGNLLSDAETPMDINKLGSFTYGEMQPDLYERAAGRPLASLSDDDLHRVRPRVHAILSSRQPGSVFVKTHNAVASMNGIPTVTPELTAAAIYVIRNPLDVVVSYADHFGQDLDETIGLLNSPFHRMLTSPRGVFQILTDWSGHVRSWTEESPGLKLHLMRYEDMQEAPTRSFTAVSDFLQLPRKRARLKRAIRNSDFGVLQAQEKKDDFLERSPMSDAFFRVGRAGEWRKVLSPAQVDRVVAAHGEMMAKHGYLP